MKQKRTEVECQRMWLNYVHPKINKARFSREEDEDLREIVNRFASDRFKFLYFIENILSWCRNKGLDWVRIAQELGTNRTAFQCIQRYQTKLNPTSTVK